MALSFCPVLKWARYPNGAICHFDACFSGSPANRLIEQTSGALYD